MRRRALWIAVSAACVVLAGVLIYRAGRSERAQGFSQQAVRLLHPPFDEAPAYSDIRATEARMLLEEEEELAASSDTRLLKAEAQALQSLQRGDAIGARRELAGLAGQALGTLRAAIELADGHLDAADSGIAKVLERSPEPRAFAIASDVARAKGQADRALAFAEHGLA